MKKRRAQDVTVSRFLLVRKSSLAVLQISHQAHLRVPIRAASATQTVATSNLDLNVCEDTQSAHSTDIET